MLVHEWLSRSAGLFPDKEALITHNQRLTYKQINDQTEYLAGVLMGMGVCRQDRVVVFLEDSAKTILSIYGVLKAGAVFVVLEGSMKSNKLNFILQNSGANVLITDTSKSQVVTGAFDENIKDCKILWAGTSKKIPKDLAGISHIWNEEFAGYSENTFTAGDLELPTVIDVDLACLIYTSGSTGEPKGVMSTHHNMITAARSIIQYIGNKQEDIILNVLPLSFDYGLYQVIMAFMFSGTVVEDKSLVYIHKILERIEKENVTGFPIVPTIAAMLIRRDDLHKYDFSSLRYVTNTGAALPVDHIAKLRGMFADASLFSMFGLTECKRVGYLPPEELDRRPGSVGKAMPNCQVHIIDDDGNEVKPGEVGELVIRGSNVMQGYWRAPDLTEKTYRKGRHPHERYLHSGDYFKMDEDGYLYFLGRKDDMIKSRGERVSPKEVENNISSFQGVAETAVIGVADEILGQAIKAYVVLSPDSKLDEKQLLKLCSNNMESFAVPKYVEIMESLPKTPNGKIDKKKLKN
ncbi:MAG: AMP-binding protein [Planctomycetes bacterium]|nr:AMP-binding protein [Planctomycetota bacterium]